MRDEKYVINKIFKPCGYVTYRRFTFYIHSENVSVWVWIDELLHKLWNCENRLEMFKTAVEYLKERIEYYENKHLDISDSERQYRVNMLIKFYEKAEKEYKKLLSKML